MNLDDQDQLKLSELPNVSANYSTEHMEQYCYKLDLIVVYILFLRVLQLAKGSLEILEA